MSATRTFLAACSAILLAAGCGGSSPAGHTGGGGAGGGGGGTPATGGNGNLSGPLLTGSDTIGTYIALGDSISADGGIGPYFVDMLKADLTAKFPGLSFVKGAETSAITDKYSDGQPKDSPTLKDQIAKLGHDYPGNVLVSITIGGNDLNGHSIAAITGTDAGFRAEFSTMLAAQLTELFSAGRLGTGKVFVVLGNIYDFTDGMGNFATVQCGPAVNLQPSVVQATFGAWNQVITDNVAKFPGTALFDMYAAFHTHGYNATNVADVWFDASQDPLTCLLPNEKGHDAIRRGVYKAVTGDTLP